MLGVSAMTAKSYARIPGSHERMNFAVAGLRSRGWAHLDSVAKNKNAIVTHICDVDSEYMAKFAEGVKERFDTPAKEVKDFRKLVEDKDLDVITVATPEHWHAPMAVMALQNGKHVYLEKPSSHNPREGELLVAAQKKYGKLIQMGNQQRSSLHTIDIINEIKEGLIGKTYYGKAWYSNNRGPIGVGKKVPVPSKLDWELWQGPAPRQDYKDIYHPYNWHWFWTYGTGETLNNGTHEVDVCRWALGVDYPNRIISSGGRYHYDDDWEFYDTLNTSFEYDKKMITWEGRSCNKNLHFGRGRGCTIHGTEGTVLIDRSSYIVFDKNDQVIKEYKQYSRSDTTDLVSRDDMTTEHFRNLIAGIKNGKKLRSPIEQGNISVTMLLLSNIAWKYSRVLELDPKNAHIKNDKEAMSMWGREYEPGWEVKV